MAIFLFPLFFAAIGQATAKLFIAIFPFAGFPFAGLLAAIFICQKCMAMSMTDAGIL